MREKEHRSLIESCPSTSSLYKIPWGEKYSVPFTILWYIGGCRHQPLHRSWLWYEGHRGCNCVKSVDEGRTNCGSAEFKSQSLHLVLVDELYVYFQCIQYFVLCLQHCIPNWMGGVINRVLFCSMTGIWRHFLIHEVLASPALVGGAALLQTTCTPFWGSSPVLRGRKVFRSCKACKWGCWDVYSRR